MGDSVTVADRHLLSFVQITNAGQRLCAWMVDCESGQTLDVHLCDIICVASEEIIGLESTLLNGAVVIVVDVVVKPIRLGRNFGQ